MTKEAIILAGGFGTRLKGVIQDVPKPMAPVAEKPFLEYLLNDLVAQGFSKVVFSTGYKSEVIEDYFGVQYKSLVIDYAKEKKPLGTGGAIKFAAQKLNSNEVFVLNGDSFIDVDYNEFRHFCQANNSVIGLVVKTMHNFDRYGTLSLSPDNTRVLKFNEKMPLAKGKINCGVYFLKKSIFQQLNMPDVFSFEKEVLEPYIEQLNMVGFESKGYFIDIGIPGDYEKAQNELPQNISTRK